MKLADLWRVENMGFYNYVAHKKMTFTKLNVSSEYYIANKKTMFIELMTTLSVVNIEI